MKPVGYTLDEKKTFTKLNNRFMKPNIYIYGLAVDEKAFQSKIDSSPLVNLNRPFYIFNHCNQ